MMLNIFGKSTRIIFTALTSHKRCYSASYDAFEILYAENGDPNKVLQSTRRTLPSLNSNDVIVKLLAAPINPADINMIQGVYPIRQDLPAIGGNEGVGEVVDVGDKVASVKIGDWVVPGYSGWGTWRTYASCTETDIMKVPKDIPATFVASMSVNPCTAYRLLKDFTSLKPGDVVIQNGANSGVGQSVIQIAKVLDVRTVNIVRNRPNIDELTESLKEYGADYVVTDEFIRTPEMKSLMNILPKPKLALNCVGGRAAAELLKYLEKKGSMVTYGGMSKQPLMVPAGPLIFSDVELRGYWMTRWNNDHKGDEEHTEMWNYLCNMVRQKTLKLPLHETVNVMDYKQAVARSMEPFVNRKQILVMDV